MPIIEVTDDVLRSLDGLDVPYVLKKPERGKPVFDLENNYVFIPSIGSWVSKERTIEGEWEECLKTLLKQGNRMLTLPEFVEFLKYTKVNLPEIYNEITISQDSLCGEWVDTFFETKGKGIFSSHSEIHVYSGHTLDSEGILIPQKSEVLDKDALRCYGEGGFPRRISLTSWLDNPTSQGLPRNDNPDGEFAYNFPEYFFPLGEGRSRRYHSATAFRNKLFNDDRIGCLACGEDPKSIYRARAVRLDK